MQWGRIKSNWEEFKGKAKQQWEKLTDAQLEAIAGRRDQLVARIQQTYDISQHAAEWQLSGWQKRLHENAHPA